MTNPEEPIQSSLKKYDSDNVAVNGLTKREWLAGIICAAFTSNKMLMEGFALAAKDQENMNLMIAIESVKQADALIAALNQQPK